MKYNYVVEGTPKPEVEEVITVSFEKHAGDFNLILKNADGAQRPVLGLRPTPEGLVALRGIMGFHPWKSSGFTLDTFGVAKDKSGRIVDLFNNDK